MGPAQDRPHSVDGSFNLRRRGYGRVGAASTSPASTTPSPFTSAASGTGFIMPRSTITTSSR